MQGRGRDQVTLPSPQNCMPHHIVGISGGQLIEYMRLPPTQSSEGSSHSVHTWHGPMTIARLHICLSWVSSKGLQSCKPQWLSPHRWIWHPAWHLKAESIHWNRHQTYKNTKWWEAQLWKRNWPVEDPWHNWHKPEEASEMGGCCCDTVASPTTPPECLSVSGGSRTTSCWPDVAGSPIKEGVMATIERRDNVLEHITVTGGVVFIAVVVEAWDILKTLQRKEQQHES